MSKEILLLSGPNLDQLGSRSPEIYGSQTLEEHVARFSEQAKTLGFSVVHVQSNFEGDLIEAIHAARERAQAIVINAGALTPHFLGSRGRSGDVRRRQGGDPPVQSRGARTLSARQYLGGRGRWIDRRFRRHELRPRP